MIKTTYFVMSESKKKIIYTKKIVKLNVFVNTEKSLSESVTIK